MWMCAALDLRTRAARLDKPQRHVDVVRHQVQHALIKPTHGVAPVGDPSELVANLA
jgi:hypothetical protein